MHQTECSGWGEWSHPEPVGGMLVGEYTIDNKKNENGELEVVSDASTILICYSQDIRRSVV